MENPAPRSYSKLWQSAILLIVIGVVVLVLLNRFKDPNTASYGLSSKAAGEGMIYYIDYASGNDANNGTSKSTPWKHAPGMRPCSNLCNSTIIKAGDSVIFKGGVTWPNASFAWMPPWVGTSSARVYFGADTTWYAGTSWTRPILDAGGTAITNNYNTMIFLPPWTTIDNFEIKGFYWSNAACAGGSYGSCGIFNISQNNGTVISNIYFHGWTHAGTDGASNNGVSSFVQGNGGQSSVAYNNIIDGSDVPGDYSMNAFFGGPPVAYNNYIKQVSSGFILGTQGMTASFHDNHIEDIGPAYCNTPFPEYAGTCTHENGFEDNGSTGLDFYNNTISNVSAGLALWVAPNPGYSVRIWNNVIYDVHTNQILDLASPVYNPSLCGTGSTPNNYCTTAGVFELYNNTVQCGDNSTLYDFCQYNINFPGAEALVYRNNHFISATTAKGCATGATNCTFATSNLVQTLATANSQGYKSNSSYAFQPTFGSGATIKAGENLTQMASGAMSALGSDSTYAVWFDPFSKTLTVPNRTPLSRPVSGSWDIGAYEYSTGTTPPPPSPTPTPPPTPVTLTISSISVTTAATSATIKWTTNVPSKASVYYGSTSNSLNLSVSESSYTTTHTITIPNLNKSARYYYQIRSANQDNTSTANSSIGNFRTKNK